MPAAGLMDRQVKLIALVPFELNGADIAESSSAFASCIVELLDVVEHVGSGGIALIWYTLRPIRSVFSDEKKLSIAALSQTLPERLIEQVDAMVRHQGAGTAHWYTDCPDPSDAARLSGLPRRQIAMMSASVTSCAVISRLHRPADNAAREQVDDCRNVKPAFGRPDVGEVSDPLLVRTLCMNRTGSIEHVRRDSSDRSLTVIRSAIRRRRGRALRANQNASAARS